MTRTTRLVPALIVFGLLATPRAAAPEGQQQVDDLRRRLDIIEQQLFQQRLAQPASTSGHAVERLQMRLDALEREVASERINRIAASVTSPKADPKAPKSIETRIAELEAAHEADTKTIAALVARIEKLEKRK